MFTKLFSKKKSPCVVERSNIIQLDDMGYPLLLCIMDDGTQQWIDVGYEWASNELENGRLCLLEWKPKRH